MAIGVRRDNTLGSRIERLFWCITAFYLVLVARLIWLQAVNGQYYRTRAEDARVRVIPQIGQRGSILDREGKPLAMMIHVHALVCDPTKIKDASKTADLIVKEFGGDRAAILSALQPALMKNGKPDREVEIPATLNETALGRLDSLKTGKTTRELSSALAIVDRPSRVYPAGAEAVHVVGFTKQASGNVPTGIMGLELSAEPLLKGTDGYVRTETDARGRSIPVAQTERVDAIDGADLRLTLDSTIQHIAQTELDKIVQKYNPRGACAIIMDPKTGDVLGMVSSPTFDPSHRDALKISIEPLRNRALEPFEPGSTLKLITAAAALEMGKVSKTEVFNCDGSWSQGRRTIKCASHGGSRAHGRETIAEIIANSCNCASGQLGVRVTTEGLKDYLNRFHLLDPTGVGLPYDKAGRIGTETGPIKAARVAFGQAVMVNPLSLAAAYCAIANGGILPHPRLIAALQDSAGKTLRTLPIVAGQRAIKAETAAYLRELLEGVVSHGTGKGKAEVPGYIVAGKTGTAQKVVPGEHGYSSSKYVASFIGFLPARNPRALIYVIVDEPHGEYYGAQVAAPAFQAIGQRLMWYWNVPPDDPAALTKGRVAAR